MMVERDLCRNCGLRQSCRQVYQKLGSAEGPAVTLRVIFAFLIPIVVFIGSLAAFERILRSFAAVRYSTAVSLAGAIAVTSVAVLVIAAAGKRLKKQ
jgi:hypothetical protein